MANLRPSAPLIFANLSHWNFQFYPALWHCQFAALSLMANWEYLFGNVLKISHSKQTCSSICPTNFIDAIVPI
jgi:hypothetical protein